MLGPAHKQYVKYVEGHKQPVALDQTLHSAHYAIPWIFSSWEHSIVPLLLKPLVPYAMCKHHSFYLICARPVPLIKVILIRCNARGQHYVIVDDSSCSEM